MRQSVSLLLVVVLTIQASPLPAEDTTHSSALEERLSDMDAEVEPFLSMNPSRVLKEETPAIERLTRISTGKSVEVVLLSGETVRGKLSGVYTTARIFTLNVGEDVKREFSFDEVAVVRELGMRGYQKALIGGAAVVGGFFLLLTIAALQGPT